MKLLLTNILRGLMYSIALLMACSSVLLVYNMHSIGKTGIGIVVGILLITAAFILTRFAVIHPKFKKIEELDTYYSDVKHFQRYHILFLFAIQLTTLILSLSVNYMNTTTYAKTYPNAEKFLLEQYNAQPLAVAIFKAAPCWMVEKTWNGAQAVYNASVLAKDAQDSSLSVASQEAIVADIDRVADKMDARNRQLSTERWLGLLFTFLWGLTYAISTRSAQYIHFKKMFREGKL